MKPNLRIREVRLQKNLTLTALSKKSEISKSYLSELENNIKSPTIRLLCKIASALNVHPGQLVDYNDFNKVSFPLPVDLYKKLKDDAKKQNCSINCLIIKMLYSYYEDNI